MKKFIHFKLLLLLLLFTSIMDIWIFFVNIHCIIKKKLQYIRVYN